MTLATDTDMVATEERRTLRDASRILRIAREVLATEADAIATLGRRVDDSLVRAVQLIYDCRGRIVVTGIGKSGHIARKIAATFASTGTPAFFVHAAEACHGDLGMIAPDDVVILVSNSGESAELVELLPHLKRQGVRIVALTGDGQSSLARSADVHLDAAVSKEACPLGVAPSASTTATLALGDAIAFALLDARGFSIDDFARHHPQGALARQLIQVRQIMRTGHLLPVVDCHASLASALVVMSEKSLGMTVVIDDEGRVAGIFTDGDLRRSIDRVADLHAVPIEELMTRTPRTITAERLAIDCVEVMEMLPKVMQLLVIDDAQRLIGAVHMHDLFRARIV